MIAAPLEEVCDPFEAGVVAGFLEDAAHEHLNGAHPAVLWDGRRLLAGGLNQAQGRPQLRLGGSARHVNLVAEDEEWGVAQALSRQQPVQLLLRLGETFPVVGVNEVDYRVHLGEVGGPESPCSLVAAKVKRLEVHIVDGQLRSTCMRTKSMARVGVRVHTSIITCHCNMPVTRLSILRGTLQLGTEYTPRVDSYCGALFGACHARRARGAPVCVRLQACARRTRVVGRLMGADLVTLQDMQQCGLASIIQAEEKDFGILCE